MSRRTGGRSGRGRAAGRGAAGPAAPCFHGHHTHAPCAHVSIQKVQDWIDYFCLLLYNKKTRDVFKCKSAPNVTPLGLSKNFKKLRICGDILLFLFEIGSLLFVIGHPMFSKH